MTKTRIRTVVFQTRRIFTFTRSMAHSRFEYVRQFETSDRCLPNCWMVIRIDGKGFHKLVATVYIYVDVIMDQ